MFLSKKNNILIFSILFILIGVFLRAYQLNFESYWLDEMISYWVADPNISFADTNVSGLKIGNFSFICISVSGYYKIFSQGSLFAEPSWH